MTISATLRNNEPFAVPAGWEVQAAETERVSADKTIVTLLLERRTWDVRHG